MNKKHIQGHATLEFALAGSVFLVLLFGVFEVGRLLFVWNTLHEITRRGARMAAVCPVNDPKIAQHALFIDNNNNNSILADMSTTDFDLHYLDETGNPLTSPETQYPSIRFVRFAVKTGTQLNTYVPFMEQSLALPTFTTTLPIESLGISRDSSTPQCLGSDS